jgi:hypothetical protein
MELIKTSGIIPICGTLEFSEPEPEYVRGRDEQGQVITDYAEHVDDALY